MIGVQGMTEPDSGSDAFASDHVSAEEGRRIRAERHEDVHHERARRRHVRRVRSTDPTKGFAGLSAFLVDRDPGFSVGTPFHKMGLRTSPMGEVVF